MDKQHGHSLLPKLRQLIAEQKGVSSSLELSTVKGFKRINLQRRYWTLDNQIEALCKESGVNLWEAMQ